LIVMVLNIPPTKPHSYKINRSPERGFFFMIFIDKHTR